MLCVTTANITGGGEIELCVGTYDNTITILSLPKGDKIRLSELSGLHICLAEAEQRECKLLHVHNTTSPSHSMHALDLLGDGVAQLTVVCLNQIHVYQVGPWLGLSIHTHISNRPLGTSGCKTCWAGSSVLKEWFQMGEWKRVKITNRALRGHPRVSCTVLFP